MKNVLRKNFFVNLICLINKNLPEIGKKKQYYKILIFPFAILYNFNSAFFFLVYDK